VDGQDDLGHADVKSAGGEIGVVESGENLLVEIMRGDASEPSPVSRMAFTASSLDGGIAIYRKPSTASDPYKIIRDYDASMPVLVSTIKSTRSLWYIFAPYRGFIRKKKGCHDSLVAWVDDDDDPYGEANHDLTAYTVSLRPLEEFDHDTDLAMGSIEHMLDSMDTTVGTEEFYGSVHYRPPDFSILKPLARLYIADPFTCIQLACIGAIRGNNPPDSHDICLNNGDSLGSLMEKGIRGGWFTNMEEGSGHGLQKRLSLTRLSHMFAEIVHQKLHEENQRGRLQKRFHGNRLPASLEFMGAVSMNLVGDYLEEHRKFAWEKVAGSSTGGVLDMRFYSSCLRQSSGRQPPDLPDLLEEGFFG
jgi:hypothetical protein